MISSAYESIEAVRLAQTNSQLTLYFHLLSASAFLFFSLRYHSTFCIPINFCKLLPAILL